MSQKVTLDVTVKKTSKELGKDNKKIVDSKAPTWVNEAVEKRVGLNFFGEELAKAMLGDDDFIKAWKKLDKHLKTKKDINNAKIIVGSIFEIPYRSWSMEMHNTFVFKKKVAQQLKLFKPIVETYNNEQKEFNLTREVDIIKQREDDRKKIFNYFPSSIASEYFKKIIQILPKLIAELEFALVENNYLIGVNKLPKKFNTKNILKNNPRKTYFQASLTALFKKYFKSKKMFGIITDIINSVLVFENELYLDENLTKKEKENLLDIFYALNFNEQDLNQGFDTSSASQTKRNAEKY